MSDVVSKQFGLMVPHGNLEGCIVFLEEGLRSLKPTSYHAILGKTFLHHTDPLADWIAEFSRKADEAKVGLAALYLELNGFAINPDQWHCDLFGYKTAGNIWDLDWLASWDAEHRENFVLTGMEDVQQVFAEHSSGEDQALGQLLAEEITEHLVTARFMQLVAAAHEAAKTRFRVLDSFPILATAHDWDVVHQTT